MSNLFSIALNQSDVQMAHNKTCSDGRIIYCSNDNTIRRSMVAVCKKTLSHFIDFYRFHSNQDTTF